MAVEPSADPMDQDACRVIREILTAHDVPVAAFIDDHVKNAIVQRNQARAKAAGLEEALRQLVYFDEGKWLTGTHGDRDVTDVVGRVLEPR